MNIGDIVLYHFGKHEIKASGTLVVAPATVSRVSTDSEHVVSLRVLTDSDQDRSQAGGRHGRRAAAARRVGSSRVAPR
jgi:hypothetical protein